MWSSTNQRIKALMSARQRERERLTRPIYVRRSDLVLSLRADDGFLIEIPARVLLNDLTPEGFCLYAVTGLNSNVEINIQLDHPKRFRLSGRVVWSQYQASSSHVITTQNYAYRMEIALLWKDAAVQEEFKKFCAELSELYVSKKGFFIEEAFLSPVKTETAAGPDPLEVPPPAESDEGGVKDENDPAIAAPEAVATAALEAANPPAPTEGTPPSGESASAVLETLNELEKKAA